jgi:hypothetical protein
MDEPFNALTELLDSVPVPERSRRFRAMAVEALQRADACEDQVARAGLVNLATKWHALALEMEHASRVEPERPSS